MSEKKFISGVHLDLKYFAPRFDYLLNWAKSLPEYGINTLLLEYEDKFPYVKYPFLQVDDAFSAEELKLFLSTLREKGIRIIPLIQTLSHLEFALGHEELAHLREREDIPTQICPSKPEAIEFVKELIDEILEYHKEDEWVHLGADEAWALGTCAKCAAAVGDAHLTYRIKHTEIFCEQVRKKGKRPIIWDDMFWHDSELVNDLADDIILANWNYGVTRFTPKMAERVAGYQKAGKEVIGCPCLSWGVLFPRPETLDNTKAHAELFHQRNTLGVINTAWACFILPHPVCQSRVAATGDTVADASIELSPDWEQRFFEKEFGTDCTGVPEALRNLSELWEIPVPGLQRPLTPVLFGCMDMILHYPDGQEERMRRGQFPVDFDNVDFNEIHRKKVAFLQNLDDDCGLRQRLDEYLVSYPVNAERLAKLAATATRNRETADLFAALAHLRTISARIFKISLDSTEQQAANAGSEIKELETAMLDCQRELTDSLSHFYRDASVKRWLRIMWEPQMTALKEITR